MKMVPENNYRDQHVEDSREFLRVYLSSANQNGGLLRPDLTCPRSLITRSKVAALLAQDKPA
jgi:hypothetical protein